MKRSEMIQIIFEELLVMMPDQNALESKAERILDKVEESGMLPPEYSFLRKVDGCSNNLVMNDKQRKWENE
jgi:hypothetical protein